MAPEAGRPSEPAHTAGRRYAAGAAFCATPSAASRSPRRPGPPDSNSSTAASCLARASSTSLTAPVLFPAADLAGYATPGPQHSGTFYSAARRTSVGYTIAYPPGHRQGDRLPLVIALHGFGGNHTDALSGLSPAQAVALKPGGTPLPPMALVTVDGGGGYWNPHPGDNPQAMLVGELIPLCQRAGLGTVTGTSKIGVLGISMGGYGAILIAEKYPRLIRAVAAISPAIWTSYAQAKSANAGAYASAADFAQDDAVTHAAALAKTPVRVAAGSGDPFYPGVQALARALPKSAEVYFGGGCHTDSFFSSQEPPSLAFLARHLALRER